MSIDRPSEPAQRPRATKRWQHLILALFTVVTIAHAKDKVVAPDWVHEASIAKTPAYPPTTDAVVLLDDIHYAVDLSGRAHEHVREVIRILRPQGRHYADLGTYFDSSSTLDSIHIWSIAADGHEYEIKQKEMQEAGVSFGFDLYNDVRVKGARATAADVGSVVAIEYERTERSYYSSYVWDTQRSIPILKQRLVMELPSSFAYKAVYKGRKAQPPVDLEHGKLLWEIQDQPAVDMREIALAPDAAGLESRIDIHYFGPGIANPTRGDWTSIGLWYADLAKDRPISNAAIAAKAHELVAGKTDFADRAMAIGEFVQQQIRYVAIEIGIGGNQPHPASAIFDTRYGDCKDKSTLLQAMLSSVGMHANYVIVDTRRGVIRPESPSIAGNHMIAAIELPAGYASPTFHSVVTAKSGKKFLIFDPTWEKTPFGHLESELQGSYGLLVDGKDSELIALPTLDPENNRIERKGTFRVAADGTLTGAVIESRGGDIARYKRALYSRHTTQEQTEALDRSLSSDLSQFSATDMQVRNVDTLQKDLLVQYTLKADRFASAMGPLLMLRPRVLGSVGMHLDHKERLVPIDLEQTRQVHDLFDIELPEGYIPDELPSPVKLDVGFAAYESTTTISGNHMIYNRTYIVRELVVPPEKYDQVKLLASAIEGDEQNKAVLKKSAAH